MRVHRSIFSTRMDIKSANARIESKITNILEPLASIAYSLGFEYHHGLIELIWKEIMKIMLMTALDVVVQIKFTMK